MNRASKAIFAAFAFCIALACAQSFAAEPDPTVAPKGEVPMASFPALKLPLSLPPVQADPPVIYIDVPVPGQGYPAPGVPLGAYNRFKAEVLYGVAYEKEIGLRDTFESTKTGTTMIKRGERVKILESKDWTWSGKGYRSGFRIETAKGETGWVPAATIAIALIEEDGNWYGIREVATCCFFYGKIELYQSELIIGGKVSSPSFSELIAAITKYSTNTVSTTTISRLDLSDLDGDGKKELRLDFAERGIMFYGSGSDQTIELWFSGLPSRAAIIFDSYPEEGRSAFSTDLKSVEVISIPGQAVRVKAVNELIDYEDSYIISSYFAKKGKAYSLSVRYPIEGRSTSGKAIELYSSPDKAADVASDEASEFFFVTDEGGPDLSWYKVFSVDGTEGWVEKKNLVPVKLKAGANYPKTLEKFMTSHGWNAG